MESGGVQGQRCGEGLGGCEGESIGKGSAGDQAGVVPPFLLVLWLFFNI